MQLNMWLINFDFLQNQSQARRAVDRLPVYDDSSFPPSGSKSCTSGELPGARRGPTQPLDRRRPVRLSKIAVPATSTVAPAATAARAVESSIPPSTWSSRGRPSRSPTASRISMIFPKVSGIKGCPPNPG